MSNNTNNKNNNENNNNTPDNNDDDEKYDDFLIIPKKDINYWRKRSQLLKLLIDMEEENFNNEGNLYLSRELFQFFDDYEWEKFKEELIKYRKVDDYRLAKKFSNYLMMERRKPSKKIIKYTRKMKKPKAFKKMRKPVPYAYVTTNNIRNRNLLDKIRKIMMNTNTNITAQNILKETMEAEKEYSKYPKSGRRPSKYNINKLSKKYETLGRKEARLSKTMKRRIPNNNELLGYGEMN